MKGVGVEKTECLFNFSMATLYLFIFNFFSVELIHRYIYALYVNQTHFICTYMSSRAFSGFKIAKIIHFCKINLQIKLNQSLIFFVYKSLENAYLRLCN